MHRITTQATLLTCLIAIFLLASCGTETGEQTATAVPTVAPTATLPPADTPEPTAEAGEEVAGTILDLLSGAAGIEKFVEFVERADLTEKLQSDGPFTVFAPVNNAFENLPADALDDPDVLQDILLLHVVAEEITIEELIAQETATSLLGDDLTTLLAAEGATVSGANILAVDIEASNGLIHILDAVVIPESLEEDVMELYPSVVGEKTYPMQGNLHIDRSSRSPVVYNSTPPTSGPHFPNIVAWQVYDEPFSYEQLVHNLEDGGVIVYYQCSEPCDDLVAQLTDVVQPFMDNGRHVVLLPNDPTWTQFGNGSQHSDMGALIAVTAWRKLLKLDAFDQEKIDQFIETYEGIDHHVRYN